MAAEGALGRKNHNQNVTQPLSERNLPRIEIAERLIAENKYIHFGGRTLPGYRSYEDLVAAGAGSEPSIETGPADSLCPSLYIRRTGQGAVAEDHPLAIRGPWKKPFTGRADAVLAIGFRFWSGEKFGEAPTWSESARYIQADATPTRIGLHVPGRGAWSVTRTRSPAALRGSACQRLETTGPNGLAPGGRRSADQL